jgi:cell wall-associated NlpC family hydrolase
MSQKSKLVCSFVVLLLFFFLSAQAVSASSSVTLKYDMRGDSVTQLQKDLKSLGFMDIDPTGYFGKITEEAVKKFQAKTGLVQDGIAGKQTLGKIESLLKRETTAYRSSGRSPQDIIDYAKKFLGIKYRWGGTTTKGFDCSGFVKYVYKKFGIDLSRTSSSQAKNGTYVKKENLKVGDLVFFDTNGGKNGINHVGIYTGSGKFIHSSSSHSKVVISSLSSGFYAKAYMTARRVYK